MSEKPTAEREPGGQRPVRDALVYALLSRAFAYPDQGLRDLCRRREFGDAALPEGVRALAAEGAGADLDRLQEEYVRLFGHVGADLPRYETDIGNAHVYQQTQELGDIAGFYRAFGLRSGSGERPDHIAVELEFLSFLAVKEAVALQNGTEEQVDTVRDAARKFLSDHLGRWAPLLASKLRERAVSGFYRMAADQLEAFVREDCARRNAVPRPLREVDFRPPSYEPEGACFSCGGQEECFPEEPK